MRLASIILALIVFGSATPALAGSPWVHRDSIQGTYTPISVPFVIEYYDAYVFNATAGDVVTITVVPDDPFVSMPLKAYPLAPCPHDIIECFLPTLLCPGAYAPQHLGGGATQLVYTVPSSGKQAVEVEGGVTTVMTEAYTITMATASGDAPENIHQGFDNQEGVSIPFHCNFV